jgi:hypothetical protein
MKRRVHLRFRNAPADCRKEKAQARMPGLNAETILMRFRRCCSVRYLEHRRNGLQAANDLADLNALWASNNTPAAFSTAFSCA